LRKHSFAAGGWLRSRCTDCGSKLPNVDVEGALDFAVEFGSPDIWVFVSFIENHLLTRETAQIVGPDQREQNKLVGAFFL
jgi:hypothetical protein